MLRALNCTLIVALTSTVFTFSTQERARGDLVLTATVSGRVADSDGDNLGDEIGFNSGVLISSAVNSSGAPGSNGTVRTQTEWNISSLNLADVGSAKVVLTTFKGSVDSVNTQFYAGANNQDGVLTNSDFEADATLIPGAVMPVDGVGTFEFDVTSFLQDSVQAGDAFFSVQGRVVDESLATTERGLQFRNTHPVNSEAIRPQLVISAVAVPEASTVLIWSSLLLGCVTHKLVRRRAAT